MDYAILGLLQGAPMTGYAVRKVFETSAMGLYSSSPGVIYPALKRLVKLELVIKKKSEGKTPFEITEKGSLRFREWLISPLEAEDIQKRMHIVLLKFAFFNELRDIANGIYYLEDMIELLKETIDGMQSFKKQQLDHLPLFGRLAFENGLEVYKSHLKWAKSAHKELSSKK